MEPQGFGSIFQLLNYELMFGSVEWGVLQHMEITLDGLIWDLCVVNIIMDVAMCDFALCDV